MMQAAIKPMFVRLSRCQEVFDMSEWTVRRLEKQGKITIYRGNGARVKVDEMERLLADQEHPPAP